MVAYVHIEYSTHQFSEESKGGGVESTPPSRSLRYRKKRGPERVKGTVQRDAIFWPVLRIRIRPSRKKIPIQSSRKNRIQIQSSRKTGSGPDPRNSVSRSNFYVIKIAFYFYCIRHFVLTVQIGMEWNLYKETVTKKAFNEETWTYFTREVHGTVAGTVIRFT